MQALWMEVRSVSLQHVKAYWYMKKIFFFSVYRKEWNSCGAQNEIFSIRRKCLSSVLAQGQSSR